MRKLPIRKSPTISSISSDRACQVRCGKPLVMYKALPRTTRSIPNVTKNEGILSWVTNQPLNRPMNTAARIANKKPSSSDVTPSLKSVHMSTGAKPNTEPTDKSNSPAIISKVMARAIIPSSGIKASRLPRLNALKYCPEDNTVKTTSSPTTNTKGPNSGRRMSF